MNRFAEFARGLRAALPVLRLWLIFAAYAAAAALQIAALQRIDPALGSPGRSPASTAASTAAGVTAKVASASATVAGATAAVRATQAAAPATEAAGPAEHPPLAPVLYATTFADAAGSLRAGRHAEAYGRFVALADEGDVDAARIALVLHRYGPELFGSQWDASSEQLAAWTAWSEGAARRDLAIPGGRPQP